jgi:hypothetical protein
VKSLSVALAACVLSSCVAADMQVRPAKAAQFADDFMAICLSNLREDARVKEAAVNRGFDIAGVHLPGKLQPDRKVFLSPYADVWTCLLTTGDSENAVTARAMTVALSRWPDGEAIQWEEPRPRGRIQMKQLHFARRQIGDDEIMVRANRLRGDLVYYLEVAKSQ